MERPVIAAVPAQEVEDAGADRHVKHRHRLVGDEELGAKHHRTCDRHALALSAAQFVRVAVEEGSGGSQPCVLQGLRRRSSRPAAPCASPWMISGSTTVSSYPEAWIERLVWVLKDDLRLAAKP